MAAESTGHTWYEPSNGYNLLQVTYGFLNFMSMSPSAQSVIAVLTLEELQSTAISRSIVNMR
jgi:hypothetical protein